MVDHTVQVYESAMKSGHRSGQRIVTPSPAALSEPRAIARANGVSNGKRKSELESMPPVVKIVDRQSTRP
jgi:hypothetical protein